MPKDIRAIIQMAPYLNGGLFKENKLDTDYRYEIPDSDFERVFRFSQRYNFTITEDSPLDQEVAVDPEMIGKVYESLVNVSDELDTKGEAGIFYTPRIEISLMCRLALVDRLTKEVGKSNKNLLYEMVFAVTDEEIEESNKKIAQENIWQKIDTCLRTLTVVDPAVWSGSFWVGMLIVISDFSNISNKFV